MLWHLLCVRRCLDPCACNSCAHYPGYPPHTHTAQPSCRCSNPPAPRLAPPTPQLISFSGLLNSKAQARVASAKLLVTDSSGAPAPGASIKLQWSNPPVNGASSFKAVTKSLVTSKSRVTGVTGTVVVTSPFAADPYIYLRVLSAAKRRGQPSMLQRANSDSVMRFYWSL